MEDLNKNITESEIASEITKDENKEVIENTTDNSESQEETVTMSKVEFNKKLQSERSKAQYNILQELGISKVEDFKTMKSNYENIVKEKDEILNKNNELQQTIKQINRNNLLRELDIREDKKNDVVEFIEFKSSKQNRPFEDIIKEYIGEHPELTNRKIEKLGLDKSENSGSSFKNNKFEGYPFKK